MYFTSRATLPTVLSLPVLTRVLLATAVLGLLPGGLILSRAYSPPATQGAPQENDLLKTLSIDTSAASEMAPDFRLEDLDGKPVRLRDLRGKVVLLNFWATWCPPCRLEMPAMEQLHREYGPRGLVILAVNFREGRREIRSFLQEQDLTFSAIPDDEAKVFATYRAWSLPTTYLIDKKGEIVGKVIGYRDWHSDPARSLVDSLLKGGA